MEKEVPRLQIEVVKVDPRSLTLLEENARYMTHEQFKKLVKNIKRDGCLTSTPLVWFDESTGRRVVMSGNHRTRAAIEAGITEIDIMETRTELTEAQRIAIQLSHNSISGQDDISILRGLYEKVLDMEMKEYSGIDDKSLDLLNDVKPVPIGEAHLKFQTLSLVFLPDELEEAKKVFETAIGVTKSDVTWLARYEEYDRWLDGIEAASTAHGIRNVATALGIVLECFWRHIDDMREGWDRDDVKKGREVPLVTIFGVDRVPVECAKIIGRACDKAISRKEIKKNEKWKLIERLFNEYFTGA